MKRFHRKVYGEVPISDIQNLIYGGVAGSLAVTLTFPTDVMRRIVQVEITVGHKIIPSYVETMKKIYSQDGLGGFFKGLRVTYYKVIPSTAIAFMSNEAMKNFLHLGKRK